MKMRVPISRSALPFLCLLFFCILPPDTVQAQQLASIPPLTSPVIDQTGTLSAADTETLRSQAQELRKKGGGQLQILIVQSTRPEDIFSYAQRVFSEWKLGEAGKDSGVLLVVAREDRDVRIHVGYGLEGGIPDATAKRIIEEVVVPKFKQDDYAGGIVAGTGWLARIMSGEAVPEQTMNPDAAGQNAGSDTVYALFGLSGFLAFLLLIFVKKWRCAILIALAAGTVALLVTVFFTEDSRIMIWCGMLAGWGAFLALFWNKSVQDFGRGLFDSAGPRNSDDDDPFSPSNTRSSSGGRSSSGNWSGGGGRSGGGGAAGRW